MPRIVLSSVPEIQQLQLAEMVERSNRMLALLTSPIDMTPDYSNMLKGAFLRGYQYGKIANGCRHAAVSSSRRHGISIK